MTGKGHLAIGLVTSMGVCMYLQQPISVATVLAGVVSALAPDLDEPSSTLSQKLSAPLQTIKKNWKVAVALLVIAAYAAYQMSFIDATSAKIYMHVSLLLTACIAVAFLLNDRNLRILSMVTLGAALVIYGFVYHLWWLQILGAFVGIAPWLPHRTWTHSFLAVAIWHNVFGGMEQYTNIAGLQTAATLGYLSHLFMDTLTRQGVPWLYPFSKQYFALPLIVGRYKRLKEVVVVMTCILCTGILLLLSL